jgi:hypothetical protein
VCFSLSYIQKRKTREEKSRLPLLDKRRYDQQQTHDFHTSHATETGNPIKPSRATYEMKKFSKKKKKKKNYTCNLSK